MDTNILKVSEVTQQHLNQSQTYAEYRTMIDQLLSEGKTTGDNHSEDMLHYTKMNVQRMKRLDKTAKLNEEMLTTIASIKHSQTWVVITEAWCGDAAQIVPVLAKIAEASPKIDLKLILRDEHLDVMDAYLTDGARSIPKLIALDSETLKELGVWGPRPTPAHEMVMERKKNNDGESYLEFATRLHGWYAKDKTQTTQKELAETMQRWI
ncbi:thioredoxin family protein [uncultured Microscilla sp.]|uniref:thioredoxin family protein n=1 Tax=uncultured Microscilla sp. TaxID=432653 RepID=UPI002610356D|nr:thioredoxin family protein [uncultured Microscilla sp.]